MDLNQIFKEKVNLMHDYRNDPGTEATVSGVYDPVDHGPGLTLDHRDHPQGVHRVVPKSLKKNWMRNMPCPICGSGRKFKKCCWGRVK